MPRFTQVDAFTRQRFAGNPAAVIPLERWPDDAVLVAIAAENNLSETAFLVAADGVVAEHELRWFTPTCEVALCGHATLAAGHVCLTEAPALEQVRFVTRQSGVLTVGRAADGYTLDLPATEVGPGAQPELLAALGVETGDIFVARPPVRDTVIVLLEDAAAVRALTPDMAALAKLGVMAICTAPGVASDMVSRVFVPAWGVEEDPVTGSAHAALAPFWAGRLGRATLTAHQASARGGDLSCRVVGDRVMLTGQCVTVIEGVIYL